MEWAAPSRDAPFCAQHSLRCLLGRRPPLPRMAMQRLCVQPRWPWKSSTLLAAVIEHISGHCCGEFLQNSIFAPLGMSNTRYGAVLRGYERSIDWIWRHGRSVDCDLLVGEGGVYSTLDDMSFGAAYCEPARFFLLHPRLRCSRTMATTTASVGDFLPSSVVN